MSRHYRKPPLSNASSSTNKTLIRYPSISDIDEERLTTHSSIERDCRPNPIYREVDDLHDLFENPTDGGGENNYNLQSVAKCLPAPEIQRNISDYSEVTRYPPKREESRYTSASEASTVITIPKPSVTPRPPNRESTPLAKEIIAPTKQSNPPPPVSYSCSDSDDPSSSESESEGSSPITPIRGKRKPNDNPDDSQSLIVPLPNETASQKKERKKAEKKEVENLVKKNKKKIMKMVSCCIVPIAALSLLRRAIEALT